MSPQDAARRPAIIASKIRLDQQSRSLPPDEVVRLAVLQQCKVIDSDRHDSDFDRFAALARRIFNSPYAFISFVDADRQWIKSAAGQQVIVPSIPRNRSVDASLLLCGAHELKLILNGRQDPLLQGLPALLGIEDTPIELYIGAAIVVDGFRLGVLSLLDTTPRDYIGIDDRQNLLDLAAAISNLVQERRIRSVQLKQQKSNLMLGLNHNLRTPLMSLTLVTEMLRMEIKALGAASGAEIGARRSATPALPDRKRRQPGSSSASNSDSFYATNEGGRIAHISTGATLSDDESQTVQLRAFNCNGTPRCDAPSKHSRSSTATPDTPCINLLGDLQVSVQQLSLLVEMGLALGKITSNMTILADGAYDAMLCDVVKVYEKVRTLTWRYGRSQVVHWYINYGALHRGKHYSHPDVLLFVLICSLSQILPHAEAVTVRAHFQPREEVTRLESKEAADPSCEPLRTRMVVGWAGMLVTKLEITGDPVNLLEIVSRLQVTGTSKDGSDEFLATSSSKSCEGRGPAVQSSDDFEEFGDNLFAMGTLLESVLGSSSCVSTSGGCTLVLSIPCRVEPDEVIDCLQEDSVPPTALQGSISLPTYGDASTTVLRCASVDPPSPVATATTRWICPSKIEDALMSVCSVSDVQRTAKSNPIAFPDPQTPGSRKKARSDPLVAAPQQASLRVLVVDDSLTVLKVLAAWLKKKNCEVSTAVNGALALEMMKSTCYDVVLLDFLMPVMDGLTALRLFKQWQGGESASLKAYRNAMTPNAEQWVLGLSATALKEDQQAAFEAGMHMFCSKPVDNQALANVLEAKRAGLSFQALVTQAGKQRSKSLTEDEAPTTKPSFASTEQALFARAEAVRKASHDGLPGFGSFQFNESALW